MNNQYDIIDFDENTGNILVKFNLPLFSETFNIELPIVDDMFIEGDELDLYIKGFIPVGNSVREKALQKGIKNLDKIKSLVKKEEIVEEKTDSKILLEEQYKSMTSNNLDEDIKLYIAELVKEEFSKMVS